MQIQKTDNNKQPSFQMRCVFRKHWNPEILRTFEDSKLVKELDKYFPDAKAYYDSYINDQRVYCPSILVNLDKDRFFKISADKKYIGNPDFDFSATNKQLAERINNATLEQVHSALIKGKVSLKKTEQVIKKAEEFNHKTNLKIQNKYGWSIPVLETFMDSKLAKDLNKQYPKSKISYKYKEQPYQKDTNYAALVIKNAKNKQFVIEAYSEYPSEDIVKKLHHTSILDVTKGFSESNAINKTKSNPFLNLLRKIFHRDK